ncbi:MAG: hypothetical protein ACRCZF_00270, partial [Gemmataceae bacterium]
MRQKIWTGLGLVVLEGRLNPQVSAGVEFLDVATTNGGVPPDLGTIATGNFAGDSGTDFAVVDTANDTLQVFVNTGGTFGRSTTINLQSVGGFPLQLTGQLGVGEFTGDGQPDLIVPYRTGADQGWLVVPGNGTAGFAPPQLLRLTPAVLPDGTQITTRRATAALVVTDLNA